MIVGFLSGLFIGAVAGVAVQRKRGMSYDKGAEDMEIKKTMWEHRTL